MRAEVGSSENVAAELESTTSYVGRFVRKQGQYGTVSVFGTLVGTTIEALDDVKRLFPRDGTVETQGVHQHSGLSPDDWVEFDAVRNARPRSTEYKVSRLRRIPRYATLTEGTESFYRVLLTREGWRGDRRPGLWALRISGDRVVVADLELGDDGALRLPRGSTRAVRFIDYSVDSVVRLGRGTSADDAYLYLDTGTVGTFDWSDEADHVARVIRSLSGANDPRMSDIITWLELHHEDGKVFAATVDHEAGLNSLRSGELADRLQADRELMDAYLAAALKDDGVARAVAAYSRAGYDEERVRLRTEMTDEIGRHRAELVVRNEAEVAGERAKAIEALTSEVNVLRQTKMAALERELERRRQIQAEKLEALDAELVRRRSDADETIRSMEASIAQVHNEIGSAVADRDVVRLEIEVERERLRDTAAEVDRLLTVADRLASASGPSSEGTRAPSASAAYAFADRPTVGLPAVGKAIDGMALLSDKGRDLARMLLVLTLSGEMPVLYGQDADDFVRVVGSIVAPGRTGLMQADPTLVSIEDLWARPGSGSPTLLAAASAASAEGTAALVALRGVELSGARFWLPALADSLRCGHLPRSLLACGIAGDADHQEIDALPAGTPFLEIEGVFAPGASIGALALLETADTQRTALRAGGVPTNVSAAIAVLGALGFEPGPGFAMRIARMAAEASELLDDQTAACALVVRIARDIENSNR